MVVLVALLALVAGLAVGWLIAGQRAALAAREAARVHALEEASLHGTIAGLQAAHSDLQVASAGLEAALDAERALGRERDALAARTQEQLRESFGALSAEALQRNSEAFMQLAEAHLSKTAATAEGQLAQRHQAITSLVEPMLTTLENVQEQVRSAERGRHAADAALREQILGMKSSSEQLRSETAQLVTALRAPQVRGRWGELQLERAVEVAGMSEHIDYVTQASVTDSEGTVRPDLVVRLVGGKQVVVDSKVSFNGYLEAMEAKDEATRNARLKAHARQLRTHIDALAAKAYWQRFTPTPEFVVCFVPADAFLDAALREDPTLMEHAFQNNVVLATPSTLIALLRTVAYAWRQEALAKNAEEVQKLGRELYQRLSTLGGHVDKLGRALGTAVGSYNSAVSSLESRVLVTARRMADLHVVEPGQTIEVPRQLTETARATQAPEYADQKLVALPKSRTVTGQVELPVTPPEASNA